MMNERDFIELIKKRVDNNDPLIFKMDKDEFTELDNEIGKYLIEGSRSNHSVDSPEDLHSYRFLGHEVHIYAI